MTLGNQDFMSLSSTLSHSTATLFFRLSQSTGPVDLHSRIQDVHYSFKFQFIWILEYTSKINKPFSLKRLIESVFMIT